MTLRSATIAGLTVALELLKDIADKYEGVSYADLFQLASATAIEAREGLTLSVLLQNCVNFLGSAIV